MAIFTSDIDIKLPVIPANINTLEDAKEELEKAYAAIHLLHKAVTEIKTRIDDAGIP